MGGNSIIHPSFRYGKGLSIGHFCVIEEDVIVGDNVNIQNFVLLKKGTRVGNNVYIDSYVHSSGGNSIGNNVILRFNVAIAREVTVQDGAYVSPNVMTIFSTHEGKKRGGTLIGKGAFVGANAVIGARVKIGDRAVVGAGAVVTKDVKAGEMVVGIPAREMKRATLASEDITERGLAGGGCA